MMDVNAIHILCLAGIIVLGPFVVLPFLFWLAGRFERKYPRLGGVFTVALWAGILALFVGLLNANYVKPFQVPALHTNELKGIEITEDGEMLAVFEELPDTPERQALRSILDHGGYTERGWPFAWWGVRSFEYMFVPGKIFLNILVVTTSCLLFCGLFALLLRLIKDEVNSRLRNPLVLLLFGLIPLWWPPIQGLAGYFIRLAR